MRCPSMPRPDPAMGHLGYERRPLNRYETEDWVTDAIAPEAKAMADLRRGIIWEPCCGSGRMARRLEHHGAAVLASDIAPDGHGVSINFLDQLYMPDTRISGIVTNPPYGKEAAIFIERALFLTKTYRGFVCMLLRHEYDCAAGRADLFGAHQAFAKKLVLTSRPRWIEGSTGSPRHNYSWYVWDWTKRPGDAPEIGYHQR